jgi:hypothetical protein
MPIVGDERAFAVLEAAGETLDREVDQEIGGAPPENLEAAAPHAVYFLGLDQLTAGAGQEATVQTGWRYLLVQEGETIGAVEIAGNLNENPVIAGVSDDGTANAFGTAIRAAEEHEEVEAGDYEARLLRVPAVYAELLWLHDRSGNTDLISPVLAVHGLEINALYPFEDALSILRQDSERVARFDSTPRV